MMHSTDPAGRGEDSRLDAIERELRSLRDAVNLLAQEADQRRKFEQTMDEHLRVTFDAFDKRIAEVCAVEDEQLRDRLLMAVLPQVADAVNLVLRTQQARLDLLEPVASRLIDEYEKQGGQIVGLQHSLKVHLTTLMRRIERATSAAQEKLD